MEKRERASVDLQREEKKQSTKAGPQCIGGIVSLLRRGEIFQCIALQDRSRVQWLPRWCHRSTHTYYSPHHACGSTSIITIPLKWPWNFQVWSLHTPVHSDDITHEELRAMMSRLPGLRCCGRCNSEQQKDSCALSTLDEGMPGWKRLVSLKMTTRF